MAPSRYYSTQILFFTIIIFHCYYSNQKYHGCKVLWRNISGFLDPFLLMSLLSIVYLSIGIYDDANYYTTLVQIKRELFIWCVFCCFPIYLWMAGPPLTIQCFVLCHKNCRNEKMLDCHSNLNTTSLSFLFSRACIIFPWKGCK